MNKHAIIERILSIKVLPVVRATSSAEVLAAVEAIRRGGISVAEITMTVPGAVDVIRMLRAHWGLEVLIGGGTVLDGHCAVECLSAGAQFLVSPGLCLDVLQVAAQNGVPVAPGALSPTEVLTAVRAGADFVKIFPVDSVGGPKYIKSLCGPLPEVRYIPTGGVTVGNAVEYLRAGAAAVGIGTDLVNTQLLAEGKTDVITERARQLVRSLSEHKTASVSLQ